MYTLPIWFINIVVPPSGVRNSYKNLLVSGRVIVSEEPSPPVTLSATNTALGIVIVCATLVQVTSKIILPKFPVAGQLVNERVALAFKVIVW